MKAPCAASSAGVIVESTASVTSVTPPGPPPGPTAPPRAPGRDASSEGAPNGGAPNGAPNGSVDSSVPSVHNGTAVSSALLSHSNSSSAAASSSAGDWGDRQYWQVFSMLTWMSRKNVVSEMSTSSVCSCAAFASSTVSMLHWASCSGPVASLASQSGSAAARSAAAVGAWSSDANIPTA